MSVYASAWARETETGSPMAKCLLFALAEFSRNDGTCYPSIRTLARVTEMSPGSIKTHMRRLIDAGLIESTPQTRGDGSQSSNNYRLVGYIASPHYRRMLDHNALPHDGGIDDPDAEPVGQDMTPGGQDVPGEGSGPIPGGGTGADPLESPIRTTYNNQPLDRGRAREIDGSILGRASRVIVEVRGMQNVDPADVAAHVGTILEMFDHDPNDPAVLAESLRFREYWNVKRASYPESRGWRSQDWHRALTNWFTRFAQRSPAERGHTIPGRVPPSPRSRGGMTTVDRSLANLRSVLAVIDQGGDV